MTPPATQDTRLFFGSTIGRIATPFREVTWADFLLADFLTSLAKPLSDTERALCHMLTGPVMDPSPRVRRTERRCQGHRSKLSTCNFSAQSLRLKLLSDTDHAEGGNNESLTAGDMLSRTSHAPPAQVCMATLQSGFQQLIWGIVLALNM